MQDGEIKEASVIEAAAFISPHHLLARDIIENIFKKVAFLNQFTTVERVILLSPNHFNVGRSPMITTDEDWNIGGKNILTDREAVAVLRRETSIFSLDKGAFAKEHGILDLLPFVNQYFPQAKVTTIMIRDGIAREKVDRIAEILARDFGEKTVIVLSADFSHYIGKTASVMHDKIALDAIANFDYEKINKLDFDCRGGLSLLEKYAEKVGFQKFNFLENSNSSEIYGRDLGAENTSYLTGYFSRGAKPNFERKTDFLFLGDLMLDREMRPLLKKKVPAGRRKKFNVYFGDRILTRLTWKDRLLANLQFPWDQPGRKKGILFSLLIRK